MISPNAPTSAKTYVEFFSMRFVHVGHLQNIPSWWHHLQPTLNLRTIPMNISSVGLTVVWDRSIACTFPGGELLPPSPMSALAKKGTVVFLFACGRHFWYTCIYITIFTLFFYTRIPTLGFQLACNHRRQILHTTVSHYGSYNDKVHVPYFFCFLNFPIK